jgi:hypothetical protein
VRDVYHAYCVILLTNYLTDPLSFLSPSSGSSFFIFAKSLYFQEFAGSPIQARLLLGDGLS